MCIVCEISTYVLQQTAVMYMPTQADTQLLDGAYDNIQRIQEIQTLEYIDRKISEGLQQVVSDRAVYILEVLNELVEYQIFMRGGTTDIDIMRDEDTIQLSN